MSILTTDSAAGRRLRLAARALSGTLLLCLLFAATEAGAAGLYFSERGVRALARAGAFTAGADDLLSIWHNPAGIYDAGSQILADASWLHYTTSYQRKAFVQQRDPATGQILQSWEQTFPEVEGSTPIIPLPTLAGSLKLSDEWVVALGLEAPYAALVSYPETLGNQPAPSRYGLITLDGSLLSIIGAWVAYAPNDDWRFGLGLEMLVGQFVTTKMMSACLPERFFCAPEDPDWDSLVQLTAGPIFAPSGNLGVIYRPHPMWRIGASFQAPFAVRTGADITIRLPGSPIFETASVEGDEADVAFELPPIARLGVEYRPLEDPELRLELTGAYEAWSIHDAITVTPDGVAMRNVAGLPNPYRISPMVIPRNFRDTGSIRLGGELTFDLSTVKLTARGGVSYESSAIPAEYLSVETIDIPKATFALGLGLHVGRLRVDATYAHLFGETIEVDPATAKVPAQSPVQGHPATSPSYINGGTYRARAHVIGLGLAVNIGALPEAAATAQPEGTEPTEEPPADGAEAGAEGATEAGEAGAAAE